MSAPRRLLGHLRPPTPDDLLRASEQEHLGLSPAECAELAPFAADFVRAFDEVEDLPGIEPSTPYGRTPGRRPSPEDDPVNAFVRVLDVAGADTGPLAGRRVGVKDNIAVAGVPLTNGSRMLPYTPSQDAVVVERILAAGGRIVGKLNLDDFSASGFGDTSVFGPTRNPLDPSRSPGGSSSGSSAAVAAGLVDLALGVDQGGSVRMPAAACGLVGLKPTHGLVPSFGVTHMDHTLDCIGPIARTVADAALLLSVIAGPDWRDPQWVRDLRLDDYAAAPGDGAAGLKVGVVAESLDADLCEPAVLRGVDAAADALRRSGATVETVSVPLWPSAFSIWIGALVATWAPMLRSYSVGFGHLGLVDVERVHAASLARREEGHLLPATIKLVLLVNRYLDERYHGVPLARAHNQRLALRQALDGALERFDLLLAPTVTRVAVELPTEPLTPVEAMSRIVSETRLACASNVTGHPALAVPSGSDERGLPTSAQVIGPRWGDRRVLAAGAAIEAELASCT
ncbi:MAG TPA: amidase family protein [Gaiellaceae bacterium]|nr:amidase family protein [Gaiellaceae bacterium]